MIITVTYNKNTGQLIVDGDVHSIEVNSNTLTDTSEELTFEIAVDTTEYENMNRDQDQTLETK